MAQCSAIEIRVVANGYVVMTPGDNKLIFSTDSFRVFETLDGAYTWLTKELAVPFDRRPVVKVDSPKPPDEPKKAPRKKKGPLC